MAAFETILPEDDGTLILYHGDSWPKWKSTLKDETNADITTYDIKAQLRDALTGELVKEQLKDDEIKFEGAEFWFEDKVDAPAAEYNYDIQTILANGRVWTIQRCKILIIQDVTPNE